MPVIILAVYYGVVVEGAESEPEAGGVPVQIDPTAILSECEPTQHHQLLSGSSMWFKQRALT